MKLFLPAIIILFSFASCKTTNSHLSDTSKYKRIYDILTVLNANSKDKEATKVLPIVYAQIQKEHLNKIKLYKTVAAITHWDAVLGEYKILQTAYDEISKCPAAAPLLTAVNYQTNIDTVKQQAANEYYQQASLLLQSKKREDAQKAYSYFKISNYWVPGYKDISTRLNEAYEKAVINIVINPIQGGSFPINDIDTNNLNEYFQQALINELNDSGYLQSKFFTAIEAKKNNVKVDWTIDLSLNNIELIQSTYSSSQKVYNEIISATDNSATINGIRYEEMARATINVYTQCLMARLEMYINIKDAITGKSIRLDTSNVASLWNNKASNYIGNILALGSGDWEFIYRNNVKEIPGKDEIVAELYSKVYPEIKNKIIYAIDR